MLAASLLGETSIATPSSVTKESLTHSFAEMSVVSLYFWSNLVPRSPTVIRKGDLVKFDFEHAQCQRGPKYGLFYHCACSYSLL